MLRPRNVAVIGGAGQMGSWLSRFFVEQGCMVTISGRRFSKCKRLARKIGARAARSNAQAVKDADLVVISVMMSRFKDVVKEIAPHVSPGQRIMDITSVKDSPVKLMHRYLPRASVLGTHPMFGPSIRSTEGQNFILTPTNSKERGFANELGAYLRSKGFSVSTMTPQQHDEMIGAILSLTHFVGFVTADTWKQLKIDRHIKRSSTSFRFLKSFVYSIVDSSPELYSYLQTEVSGASRAESIFVAKSRLWADLAKKKRNAELISRMSKLRSYMSRLE